MNANELADELETGEFIKFFELHTQFWKRSKIVEAVAMLRQQQAEIEALKMMLANRNDIIYRLDLK